MKKFTCFLFSFLFLIAAKSLAQESSSVVTSVARVTLLNPGFSYEMKTGKISTIYLHAYATTLSSIGYNSTFGWNAEFIFDPSLSLQYRFFYNAKRRMEKGKRIEKNSMNYIAPVYQVSFSKEPLSDGSYINNNRRPINELGVVWGIQRNYRSGFSLGFNIGPGVFFGKDRIDSPTENITVNIAEFTLVSQLELAFWLGQ